MLTTSYQETVEAFQWTIASFSRECAAHRAPEKRQQPRNRTNAGSGASFQWYERQLSRALFEQGNPAQQIKFMIRADHSILPLRVHIFG